MAICEVLAKALVESLVFAELTDDETLDPRAAVKHEESMAYILQELTKTERQMLIKLVRAIADEEEKAYGPSVRVAFIRSIPQGVGFED